MPARTGDHLLDLFPGVRQEVIARASNTGTPAPPQGLSYLDQTPFECNCMHARIGRRPGGLSSSRMTCAHVPYARAGGGNSMGASSLPRLPAMVLPFPSATRTCPARAMSRYSCTYLHCGVSGAWWFRTRPCLGCCGVPHWPRLMGLANIGIAVPRTLRDGGDPSRAPPKQASWLIHAIDPAS